MYYKHSHTIENIKLSDSSCEVDKTIQIKTQIEHNYLIHHTLMHTDSQLLLFPMLQSLKRQKVTDFSRKRATYLWVEQNAPWQ